MTDRNLFGLRTRPCRDARDSVFEYAVLSWHPQEGLCYAGPGLGAAWTDDYDRVKQHYDYLTGEWRERLEAEAAANEASGFKGDNWAYMAWNAKQGGSKKYLRFAIAKRPKAGPSVIVTAEDGFQVGE